MKLRHTLIMSAAFLMAYRANAGTPSTIDPAAKEIASMMCRWVLDGGKLTDPAQRLTIYENGKYERWLELHPSDKGACHLSCMNAIEKAVSSQMTSTKSITGKALTSD